MKTNLKTLIEGAETLADILRDYEIHDNHDVEMMKDGRSPEGKDKFIGISRLIALGKELRELDWRKYGTLSLIKELLGESE